MADLLTLLSSTTLFSASVNYSPIHDYYYNYYDGYSSPQLVRGTHFYQLELPEITLQGLTHIKNHGLIWKITTPHISEKYKRGVNLSGTFYYDHILNENSLIRMSFSFNSYAKETAKPCTDDINRTFHCYFGTQPNSPLFSLPFERVVPIVYRQYRTLDFVGVGVNFMVFF